MESEALYAEQPSSVPTYSCTVMASPDTRLGRHCSSAKALLRKPAFAAACGAALLLVGVVLLLLPAALPAKRHWVSSPATTKQQQHQKQQQQAGAEVLSSSKGGIPYTCQAQLHDPKQYAEAAAAAEHATLGALAADLGNSSALQAALARLPRLRVPLLLWALHSPAHPASPQLAAAARASAEQLNMAFARAGVQFSLVGVVGVAASDEAVTGCASADPGTPGFQAVQGLLSEAATTVNVVVCEPEGGSSTAVLSGAVAEGEEGEEGEGFKAQRIVVSTRDLLRYQTGLVHQMGHYFGLPHPFPEDHGCRADADFIEDTPRQHSPNSGCDLGAGMGLCKHEDGPIPAYNFMDLTNDTCRRQFTYGQAARMRSMAQQYRPQLHAAAARAHYQTAIPFGRALQSGLPLPAVRLAQAEAAAAAAAAARNASAAGTAAGGSGGSSSSSTSPGSPRAGSVNFGDAWGQAALAAADGLRTELQSCSCLGPDPVDGRMLWVGELAAGAQYVDALRLLLRWGVLGAEGAPCSGKADAASRQRSEALGGLVCGTEPLPVLVDVRVGHSANPRLNARCTPDPVPLTQVLQTVECSSPLAGRFVSVEVVGSTAPGQQQPAPCLCAVQPLSFLANPQPIQDAPAASVPGGIFQPGRWWRARQSTTLRDASLALRRLSLPVALPRAVTAGPAATTACSSTAAERGAWWALETGLDSIAVRGLHLAMPNACPAPPTPPEGAAECNAQAQCSGAGGSGFAGNASAAAGCAGAQPRRLSVYVGDSVSVLTRQKGFSGEAHTCASGVLALPGQLLEVDCGRLMHGSVVVVRLEEESPEPLELCWVEVVGAVEVPLVESLTAQHKAAVVEPKSLLPYMALPVDGDLSSCLSAPSQQEGTSYALPLKGLHHVLALTVTAAGRSLTVSLLSAAGAPIWDWHCNDTSASEAVHTWSLEMEAAAVPATWLALRGFQSLCEVRMWSTSSQATTPFQVRPAQSVGPTGTNESTSGEATPEVHGLSGSSAQQSAAASSDAVLNASATSSAIDSGAWVVVTSSGLDASAAVDGNYRTCVGTEAEEQPWVLLLLDGTVRVDTLKLVSDQLQPNITLHLLPPGSAASFRAALGLQTQQQQQQQGVAEGPAAAAGPAAPDSTVAAALELAGAQLCASEVELQPWVESSVPCATLSAAEGLVLQAGDSGIEEDGREGGTLRLCEVGLMGAAAVPLR